MKIKSLILISIFVNLAAIAVIIPIFLLIIWCFVNRWPWPELFPQTFTMRGVNRLFSGYLNIGNTLISSVLLSLLVGTLATIIATMTARAIALYSFKGKRFIEWLALLPLAVPATVFSMGGHTLFLRLGIGNTALAVIIGHLIYTLPFAVSIMLNVTAAGGSRFEEQARVLGAPPLSAFWHGSLPVLTPGIVSALAVSFLMSYNQSFLTLILGGGKVKTLAVISLPLITGGDRTISSVYSVLYIVSTLTVFMVFQRLSAALAKRVGTQLMI